MAASAVSSQGNRMKSKGRSSCQNGEQEVVIPACLGSGSSAEKSIAAIDVCASIGSLREKEIAYFRKYLNF